MDKSNLVDKNYKIWWLAAIVFILLIIFLYPESPFEGMKMEVTRSQAIKTAEKFLAKQNINLDGYLSDGFITETRAQTTYLLNKLGTKNFKSLIDENKLPIYGWDIRFYKNTSQGEKTTLYSVYVSYSGKIMGYRRTIPDTDSLYSISVEEAKDRIIKFISSNSTVNINEFNLVESKVDNFSKRKDFTFIWEKEISYLKSKLVIRASIQGHQPGSFLYSIEVPPEDTNGFETGQTFLFSISVIFIFFLTQFSTYLFLKKYHEGEVWINVGKNLFLIFFISSWIGLINSWTSIGQGVQIGNLNLLLVKIIVFASIGFLVRFFLGLLVFSSWSVGESYTREFWPEKLRGTDAFIKGHIFSLPSGVSLMRGLVIGAGASLIYLAFSILCNTKNFPIQISTFDYLRVYSGFSPALDLFIGAFTGTILASIPLNFFVISIVYNKWKKKWLSIIISGIITSAGSVIAANTIPLYILFLNLFFVFLLGCFSSYIFFKYDLLTVLSTHYHLHLIYNGLILYAGKTTYYQINFILFLLEVLIVPIIFLITMLKKKDFVLENFGLPAHIKKISERERLKKEMEIAAKVQLSLLPKEQPKLPGYEIASISLPAKEAGGDYYDFIKLTPNKLGIAIGDVSGKGVGAAIYMTLTKGIFQAHAEEEAMPRYVLAKVNKLLYKTIEKNSFVSMIYAILDTVNNTLTYSRAGHNPGIFFSSGNCSTQSLRGDGIALGLDSGSIFNKVLVEEQVYINKNDLILFYTDGFTEAMNERLEEFGEERLTEIIKNNQDQSPKSLLELILKEVNKFVDVYPQHDDMTIVILKRI